MKTALILGATSDIGMHIAEGLAKRNYNILFTGRNQKLLDELKNRLQKYDVEAADFVFDVEDFSVHKKFYDSFTVKPEVVFCCIGYYEDQARARLEYGETARTINVNLTGIVSILNIISNDFEKRRSGSIVVLSSVAGERGRQLNYIYGSAKAGLTVYLSGLRNYLYKSNISVTTVKLGPVYTKMSEGHNLMPVITLKPEIAAEKIIRAGLKKKDIVYILWVWRYIMLIIKLIPEFIFKRLSPF